MLFTKTWITVLILFYLAILGMIKTLEESQQQAIDLITYLHRIFFPISEHQVLNMNNHTWSIVIQISLMEALVKFYSLRG